MSLDFNASIVLDKGLSNYLGHNNCFLNSAVQVLWHLDVFRKNLLLMKYHDCVQGSCIYCALQEIFKEFNQSGDNVLHPDMLRVTLAVSFQDQLKFQLGELDDASECYENILSRVHFHLSHKTPDDFCSLEHCITHKKFAMSLIQQSQCSCGTTSEPLSYVQLVHYISTSSIVNISKDKTLDFGEVLRLAFTNGSANNVCPLKCSMKCKTIHTLVNLPDVISIGLIWNSDQPHLDDIRAFVSAIGTVIYLEDLFDNMTEKGFEKAQRNLVGVVCYYLKHYSTFFFHSKRNTWISFDDASVTEIGEEWGKVVDKCCRGKYQPLLLIYQNQNAKLVDTKSAPNKTTLISKGFENKRSSNRSIEDSQESSSRMKSAACDSYSNKNYSNNHPHRDKSNHLYGIETHNSKSDQSDVEWKVLQTDHHNTLNNNYKSKHQEPLFYNSNSSSAAHMGITPSSFSNCGSFGRPTAPEINASRDFTTDSGMNTCKKLERKVVSKPSNELSCKDNDVINHRHHDKASRDIINSSCMHGNMIEKFRSDYSLISDWTFIEAHDSNLNENDHGGSLSSIYDNVSSFGHAQACCDSDLVLDSFVHLSADAPKRDMVGDTDPHKEHHREIDTKDLDEIIKSKLIKDKVRAIYRT